MVLNSKILKCLIALILATCDSDFFYTYCLTYVRSCISSLMLLDRAKNEGQEFNFFCKWTFRREKSPSMKFGTMRWNFFWRIILIFISFHETFIIWITDYGRPMTTPSQTPPACCEPKLAVYLILVLRYPRILLKKPQCQ